MPKNKPPHHCISPFFIIPKPKRFQDSKTYECTVFGHGHKQRGICNFSGECENCPKFREAKAKRKVS